MRREAPLDRGSCGLQSWDMAHSNRIDVNNAGRRLRALLMDAERGRSTIITRYGRSIAAIVPVDCAADLPRQKSLLGLAGSGKGLWGKDSAKTLRRLRDEWRR